MKQTVAHKKLRPWQGILLILAVIAALVLIKFLLSALLMNLIGYTACSVAFWVIGAAIAYWVFRRYIATYTYDLSADVLRLCRSYGKRERFICDIYLNRVLFVGTAEDARKKFGKTGTVRAMRGCDHLPVTAIVYDSADGRRTALIQADDELKGALVNRMKRK